MVRSVLSTEVEARTGMINGMTTHSTCLPTPPTPPTPPTHLPSHSYSHSPSHSPWKILMRGVTGLPLASTTSHLNGTPFSHRTLHDCRPLRSRDSARLIEGFTSRSRTHDYQVDMDALTTRLIAQLTPTLTPTLTPRLIAHDSPALTAHDSQARSSRLTPIDFSREQAYHHGVLTPASRLTRVETPHRRARQSSPVTRHHSLCESLRLSTRAIGHRNEPGTIRLRDIEIASIPPANGGSDSGMTRAAIVAVVNVASRRLFWSQSAFLATHDRHNKRATRNPLIHAGVSWGSARTDTAKLARPQNQDTMVYF